MSIPFGLSSLTNQGIWKRSSIVIELYMKDNLYKNDKGTLTFFWTTYSFSKV